MRRKKTVNQSVVEENDYKIIDEVERLEKEVVLKNSKEGKKARRNATKRERRSNLSYNGFGAKNIEFDMFLTTMQYICSLNAMLRTDNRQSHTNKKTSKNICIFNNKAYLYGDLENRIELRREIIRYTNFLERERNLEKDKIIVQIGSIDYRYDKYITETINERVINDALRRINGINEYMQGRYRCFVGFLLNDFRSRAIVLYIFAVQEFGNKESKKEILKEKSFFAEQKNFKAMNKETNKAKRKVTKNMSNENKNEEKKFFNKEKISKEETNINFEDIIDTVDITKC